MILEILKERFFDLSSIQDMEMAYRNIIDELINHVMEGICFEAHRAVKRGYFPMNEYILKNLTFEKVDKKLAVPQELPQREVDIFGNGKNSAVAKCPECDEQKHCSKLLQHYNACFKNNNITTNGEEECLENDFDGNDGDGKEEYNTRRQAKSAPTYESMTPEEIRDFLSKKCGVISRRTERPCNNPIKCKTHSSYDKNEVRDKIFRSWSNHWDDDNIDLDTVD